MSRKNVFLYDIDVPEIVQEKAEAAFLIIKAEGERTMKEEQYGEKNKNAESKSKSEGGRRNKKGSGLRKRSRIVGIVTGAAVCAAVITLAVSVKWIWNRPVDYAENGTETEGIPVGEEGEDENFLTAIDHMFTLQVQAAELEEGQPVPLVDNAGLSDHDTQINGKQASNWVMGGTEDGGVDYCIGLPLTCTGSNIEKITYSINQGAFQIVQPKGESIIIDGELYDGELNTGMIGGTDEESDDPAARHYETVLYRSFTLDYRKQSDQYTWINLCNEVSGKPEILELIWGEGKSLEEKNQGMQNMFNNTIITCTVQFQDKTTKSVDIQVNSRIMTCAEAGVEAKEDPNRKELFITFELLGEKD